MNILREFTGKLTKLFPIIIMAVLYSSNTAFARFMIEPQYRVYSGDYKGNGRSGDLHGEGNAIHIGYIGEFFMAGVSAEKGWMHIDGNIMGNGSENFVYGGLGTYMGFHFMNRLKIYTGYVNTTLEPTNVSTYRFFGQQVNFGIGWRIVDFIILHYEYMNNFHTQEENDITGKTDGLSSNIRSNKQAYGISFIFVF